MAMSLQSAMNASYNTKGTLQYESVTCVPNLTCSVVVMSVLPVFCRLWTRKSTPMWTSGRKRDCFLLTRFSRSLEALGF